MRRKKKREMEKREGEEKRTGEPSSSPVSFCCGRKKMIAMAVAKILVVAQLYY